MKLKVSQSLQEHRPDLVCDLKDIAFACRSRDRGIHTRNLYVEVRGCNTYGAFSGTAHPCEFSWDRRWNQSIGRPHSDGKVTMTINFAVTAEGVCRLFAHELRHIGQFHRGRKRFGCLTIASLTPAEAETDAHEFEDVMLTKMGL